MSGDHGQADEHTGPGWFRVLDVLVWASIAVIVILGIEFLVGKIVRERIAAGFRPMLKLAAERSTDG